MKEIKEKNKFIRFIVSFFKCIAWAILIILMIIALCLVYYVILQKKAASKGMIYKPPMALYTIVSPSMQPNINVYDVVLSIKEDPENIKKGDVITFYSNDEALAGKTLTHRVIEVKNTKSGLKFKTKGDNNVTADTDYAYAENVVGVIRFRIPQLGRVQFFLQSKSGWFVAILIPALLVLSIDILKLCKQIAQKAKEKKTIVSKPQISPEPASVNPQGVEPIQTNIEKTQSINTTNPVSNTVNTVSEVQQDTGIPKPVVPNDYLNNEER